MNVGNVLRRVGETGGEAVLFRLKLGQSVGQGAMPAALLDDAQKLRDICASVQAAIVETLVTKTIRASRRFGVKCVTASGGVTCNRSLRAELDKACQREGFALRLADRSLCTDNAAMIGVLAERKLLKSTPATSLDAEIEPGWALG